MPSDIYIEKEKGNQDIAKSSKDPEDSNRSLRKHDEMDLSGAGEMEKDSETENTENWSRKFDL